MTSLDQITAWAAAGESETLEFKHTTGERREAARMQYRALVYIAGTRDNMERLSHLADAAAYPAVRADVVAGTRVLSDSGAVLVRFARIADPLLANILAAEHESRTVAALRDALLPKLVSGGLRVSPTEHVLERIS